ncbi:MAG: PD40 domain-containing protein [Acidobacteria bacterium]|nr:PD40 domain-containing protein [Acidobacteriota bacterium]
MWKVTADPGTLRWNGGPERLTAGPGPDRDLALSADGKKLAFSARRESTRYWAFPFNATTGKVTGAGQPVSPEGVDALEADLTPDGDKLVFGLSRAGKYELWAKSLLDGKETLLAKDEFVRDVPRWSPDGKHLVYRRMRAAPNQPWQQSQVVLLGERGKGEQALTSEYPPAPYTFATGWSPDGQNIVVSRAAPAITIGIWVMPVSDPARAEAVTRLVTDRPGYNLYLGRFSPNGNWISFYATTLGGAPGTTKVTIFVVPATGGEWVRISEDGAWSDKARWSPDGRTLYYVSSRTGFFNVWGRRFDPVRGQPVGDPFLVASFENPSRIIPLEIGWFEISLSEARLVVPITEITGNIWMLENVNQ